MTRDNSLSPQRAHQEGRVRADNEPVEAQEPAEPPLNFRPRHDFIRKLMRGIETDLRRPNQLRRKPRATSNDPGQGSSSHTSPEANPGQAPNSDTVEIRTSLEIIPDATQGTQDNPSSPQETHQEIPIRAGDELVKAEVEPRAGSRRKDFIRKIEQQIDKIDFRNPLITRTPSRAQSPVSNNLGQGFSSLTSPEGNPGQAPNTDTVEEIQTSLEIIPDTTQRTQDNPSSPQETRREIPMRAGNELVKAEVEPRAGSRRKDFIRKIEQQIDKIDFRNPLITRTPSRAQSPVSNNLGQSFSSLTSPEGNPGQAPNLDTVEGARTSLEIISDTTQSSAGTSHVPGISRNSAISNPQPIPDASDVVVSEPLKTLRKFNLFVNGIPNTRHDGKVVMSVFTCASKMILDQADFRVNTILVDLLKKVSEVFVFMMENRRLAKISSMPALYGRLARQTLECADFIVHYSEIENTLKQDSIQRYSRVLDDLIQQFGRVFCGTALNVHHISEDLGFADLAYVNGAGLDTSKRCLPGTREGILSEIKDWVDDTGEDVPRVLWLYGTAGKGKSAVAHTIANWFDERSGPGACFCFDRSRQAERRHEKIFTTIARDLADRDPIIRRALARALRDDDELKHTADITRQWKEFILGPLNAASIAVDAPVLIVIDALDESGDAHFQEQILSMLVSTSLTPLPKNSRIIVTSRPLEDIANALLTAQHVRHVSMDDISNVSTERDIQRYISTRLTYDDGDIERLAQKSDGLFIWARLACDYVIDAKKVGAAPMERFKDLLVGPPEEIHLLDTMYRYILTDIIPEDEHAVTMFCSVMGQILASSEPLSMAALTSMRLCFPREDDRYDVKSVISKLGSLFTGTTDSHTPIRPVHTSFYNFLTDKSRSDEFFVDTPSAQSDLAFASLRVMEHGLRFNICSLKSSYLPNAAVPDLEEQVKNCIPAELSYSCRFWGTHAQAISFDPLLVKEVKAFLNEERLLFWLEALSLMKDLNSSIGTLSSVADWLKGHDEHTDIYDIVVDTRRFVRIFAPVILYSTPHLYLSALPFAPTQSKIFRTFSGKFPRTPRILAGHVVEWPQMANMLFATSPSPVNDVAISPDGTYIACGSDDGKIQVWHAGTGEALFTLFQGHTGPVISVTFSPDGKNIMSGSDETIQIWDMETGELSRLLRGHTDRILSVAVSPDGTRIVSGSADNTIRVWSMDVGDAPIVLEGHSDVVYSIAISPDSSHIISGSADRTIRIWDAGTGKVLTVLQGHTDRVHSIAISPDGKYIMSGSSDETIRVWDTIMGQALGIPLQGHTGRVLSVAISPDGRCMASGSDDMTIRVWDAEIGEALGVPLRGHTDYVRCIAISPNGSYVVSGSDDKTVRMWDLQPPVCSPGNLTHALCSAFSLPQESTSLTPNEEGWVVDPDGQLLLWIPIHSHLILDDSWKVDLSCFEHGMSWHKCREQVVLGEIHPS